MGRVAEYSQNEIIKAGEHIESNGKHVNPFAIRAKLGGGSPDRIKRIWETHLQSRKAVDSEEGVDDVIELPTEIQEALSLLLTTIPSSFHWGSPEEFSR